MKNKSIWKEGVINKNLPPLKKNIACDILIIGGGVAGLMTAYFLRETDKKIVLIDKDKCAEGASSKNTGKLTFMQELVYHKIENNYDFQVASLYLNSQKDALSLAERIINKEKIKCNFEKVPAYVISNTDEDEEKFHKEIMFYKKNNIKCEKIDKLDIPFPIKMGIKTYDSARFNPYKFLLGIKEVLKDKINIYENTRCLTLTKKDNYYLASVENNREIKAKIVVVATQYPFFIYPYFVPFKTTVEKSFITSGPYKIYDFEAITSGKEVFSFNFYHDKKDYLIYARRSHSVTSHLDTREDQKEILREYQKYFHSTPSHYFQNHDLMTYDYMPFVGKIDNQNMYVLTGFNKWGNTNGIISGKLVSDLIQNKKNKYAALFSPHRHLSLLKIKNLTIYNFKVMTRYLLGKISSNMSYYDNSVEVKMLDGQKCGIYTDDNNQKHIVSNICPHMKCNLVFNYVDKTWDCPCHASRFDIDGNVLNGPSTYNIKITKNND